MKLSFREKLFALRMKLRYNEDFQKEYEEAKNNEKLSREQMSQLNFELCKKTVQYAYEHSPFYKQHFDKNGFKPESLKSPSDWGKVPILTKQDIKDHFDEIIVPECYPQFGSISTTGGSTGKPTKVIKDTRNHINMMVARALDKYGVSISANRAVVGRNVTAKSKLTRLINDIYLFPAKKITLDAESVSAEDIQNFVKKINRVHPQIITGYVGTILNIARYIVKNHLNVHRIDVAWVTSAPISEAEKQIIRKAFHGDVMDQYGSVEISCLGFESPEHIGLYVPDDYRKIEIVDDENKPLGNDTYGNIVVTDFMNRTFPLIRYRNGDRSKIIDKGGKLPFTLLAPIKGRVSDYIITPKSQTIVSGEYLTTIFDDYADYILSFQVHQHTDFSTEVKYVSNPQQNGKAIDEIVSIVKERLSKFMKNEIVLSFTAVDNIPDDRGKTRYIINDITSNYNQNQS